jgi:hypothetical protein
VPVSNDSDERYRTISIVKAKQSQKGQKLLAPPPWRIRASALCNHLKAFSRFIMCAIAHEASADASAITCSSARAAPADQMAAQVSSLRCARASVTARSWVVLAAIALPGYPAAKQATSTSREPEPELPRRCPRPYLCDCPPRLTLGAACCPHTVRLIGRGRVGTAELILATPLETSLRLRQGSCSTVLPPA